MYDAWLEQPEWSKRHYPREEGQVQLIHSEDWKLKQSITHAMPAVMNATLIFMEENRWS